MKLYDKKQFTGIENIDKVHKMNKKVTITAILIVPLVVLIALIAMVKIYMTSTNSIYTLTQDGVSVFKRTRVQENREVEAKRHIHLFYNRFVDQDPNAESIEKSLESAYHLGGDVIKDLAEFYYESGWFNKIIRENLIIRHELKSEDITVDMSTYPYKVIAKGTQVLKRYTNEQKRTFYIKCTIYDLKERTDENPHGMWIEDLLVTDNK